MTLDSIQSRIDGNSRVEYDVEDEGKVITRYDGVKYWCINGKLHRERNPAILFPSGEEHWFINGKRHRENGPAIILSNGDEYWYINDKNVTEQVKDYVHNWKNWTDKDKFIFKLKFM